SEPIKVFLGIPLVRGGDRLGVLGVLSSRWLSDEEVTLLSMLARHVAFEASASSQGGQTPGDRMGQGGPAEGSLRTFTSRMTHELRSPLTSLRGNVQLAARAVRNGDPDRAEKRL